MDWQAGDLAVCVDVSVQHTVFVHVGTGLSLGATYRVDGIGEPSMAGLPTLILSDVGRKFANRFRKIRPDEHEACEPEFVTLLKRTKVRA
jgi:hypothetical protein